MIRIFSPCFHEIQLHPLVAELSKPESITLSMYLEDTLPKLNKSQIQAANYFIHSSLVDKATTGEKTLLSAVSAILMAPSDSAASLNPYQANDLFALIPESLRLKLIHCMYKSPRHAERILSKLMSHLRIDIRDGGCLESSCPDALLSMLRTVPPLTETVVPDEREIPIINKMNASNIQDILMQNSRYKLTDTRGRTLIFRTSSNRYLGIKLLKASETPDVLDHEYRQQFIKHSSETKSQIPEPIGVYHELRLHDQFAEKIISDGLVLQEIGRAHV